MRQLLRLAANRFFRLLGVDAHFARGGKSISRVLIDKNVLELHFKPNGRMGLYKEALRRAGVKSTDNFLKQSRFFSLQQMVGFVLDKKIAGDFAECGCWKGHSSYIVAKILKDKRFPGFFHIFDSFEGGLSDKGVDDANQRFRQSASDIEREKKFFSSTEKDVRKVLAGFDFVRIYKGWIPDRFSEIEDRKFAFVHVDVDLYQPTFDSLQFFYSRLSPGGVVVINDYGYTQFPGVKKAVDRFLSENKYNMFYELPIGSCFVIR